MSMENTTALKLQLKIQLIGTKKMFKNVVNQTKKEYFKLTDYNDLDLDCWTVADTHPVQ